MRVTFTNDETPELSGDGRTWIFPDGTRLPVVSGGADEGDPPGGDPDGGKGGAGGTGDPDPTDPDGGDKARTFTQEDLNRIAATEADKATRKERQRLTDELGVTPEEAKKILDAAKAKDREAMTEAERLKAEAAEAKDQADRDRAEARADRRTAAITAGVSRAGISDDGNRAAVETLVASELEGADEVNAETVDAAVATIKERTPALFAASSGGGGSPSSEPAGGAKPPAGGGGNQQSAVERAADRAKRMGLKPEPATAGT